MLNSPVKVGNVDLDWLNRLTIRDVSIDEPNGETLFGADHISAGFKLFPVLFKKQWVFTTVRLFGFSLNLKKDTPESPLNLQFLIDALASKDTIRRKSTVDLQIHTVQLRNGEVNYHIANIPDVQQKFDANHIQVRNLDAKISVRIFGKDSLNAQINKLSFEEHSGFKLNKLSMNIAGNQDSLSVGNLSIYLPNTSLQIAGATLQYKIDSLSPALAQAPIQFQMKPSRIRLQDFAAFIPVFKSFTDDITLSVDASGSMNDLTLEKLRLKQQNNALELTGKLNLKGITRKDETYLYGKVSEFHLTTDGLTDYINHFREQPEVLPAPLVRLGNLHFSGEISGFIDHLVAYGNLHSDIGSLKIDMLIGRNKAENIANYMKGQIESSDLIIHDLFNDGNPYGMVRFNAGINTSIPVNGSFSGNIQANINQFDYNGYQYENILLAGNFRQNEFDGTIEVDDPNGKLYAEGLFKNQGKNSISNFSINLTDFRPDKLHLTDKYENPVLSLSMTTDFTGNSVDNFEGHISVENLAFLTQPDSFYLNTLQINAASHSSGRKLTVTSDILNGEVTGAYSFSTLWSSFLKTGQSYLPSLSNALQENQKINENAFVLAVTIENTESLSKTLKLPFTVIERGTITGQY
ncbi:MAG: translocation/assembly module TamB, partial [Tannerella sp.]|nr:translocation/assembly module TamB [Tannerella sp.]